MARTVSLRSRFPQIISTLQKDVNDAVLRGTKPIVEQARSRVHVRSGDLRESLEAKPDGQNQVGIFALWRWFFEEFGTSDTPAHPFLMPAVEALHSRLVDEVVKELRVL